MGEYWKPVNVTRREYIHPHDIGYGKLGEMGFSECDIPYLSGIRDEIKRLWPDESDVVAFVSDYGNHHIMRGIPIRLPSYEDLDAEGYKRVSKDPE